jgi:hypothetical protein
LGYSRASHVTINSIAARDVDTTAFNGGSIRGYYNALPNGFKGVVGVSFGAERASNYAALKKSEYREDISIVSADTTRVVSTTVSGRRGELEMGWAQTAAADVVWLPVRLGGSIGVNIFGRYEGHEFVEENIRGGAGLLITKENRPTEVVGALSVTFGTRPRAGLVVGFTF